MNYEIPLSIVANSPQVFAYQANGRRVFVKKRRPAKNPLGWTIQRIIYGATGFLLVMPPAKPGKNNVLSEVAALRRMAEAGVRVPEVLYVTDEYFVMSDAGVCLETALRENPETAPAMIEQAVRELRSLHDRGLAHGGAQVKNFTLRLGEIHFIDFEESIPQEHIAKFQLRDMFLFIFSLERTGHDPDLAKICAAYDGREGGETLANIRRALLQLRITRLCEARLFSRYSMRDIRSLGNLVKKAERIPVL